MQAHMAIWQEPISALRSKQALQSRIHELPSPTVGVKDVPTVLVLAEKMTVLALLG